MVKTYISIQLVKLFITKIISFTFFYLQLKEAQFKIKILYFLMKDLDEQQKIKQKNVVLSSSTRSPASKQIPYIIPSLSFQLISQRQQNSPMKMEQKQQSMKIFDLTSKNISTFQNRESISLSIKQSLNGTKKGSDKQNTITHNVFINNNSDRNRQIDSKKQTIKPENKISEQRWNYLMNVAKQNEKIKSKNLSLIKDKNIQLNNLKSTERQITNKNVLEISSFHKEVEQRQKHKKISSLEKAKLPLNKLNVSIQKFIKQQVQKNQQEIQKSVQPSNFQDNFIRKNDQKVYEVTDQQKGQSKNSHNKGNFKLNGKIQRSFKRSTDKYQSQYYFKNYQKKNAKVNTIDFNRKQNQSFEQINTEHKRSKSLQQTFNNTNRIDSTQKNQNEEQENSKQLLNSSKIVFFRKKKANIKNASNSVMVQKIIDLKKNFNKKCSQQKLNHTNPNHSINSTGQIEYKDLVNLHSFKILTPINRANIIDKINQAVYRKVENQNTQQKEEKEKKKKERQISKKQNNKMQERIKLSQILATQQSIIENKSQKNTTQKDSLCQQNKLSISRNQQKSDVNKNNKSVYSSENHKGSISTYTLNYQAVQKPYYQKQQIKQIRAKYIHSRNSAQDGDKYKQQIKNQKKYFPLQKHSMMISCLDQNMKNNRQIKGKGWRAKSHTQPIIQTQEFLDIQRKVTTQLKKNSSKYKNKIYQITANFKHKQRKHNNSILNERIETIYKPIRIPKLQQKFKQLQPWKADKRLYSGLSQEQDSFDFVFDNIMA